MFRLTINLVTVLRAKLVTEDTKLRKAAPAGQRFQKNRLGPNQHSRYGPKERSRH